MKHNFSLYFTQRERDLTQSNLTPCINPSISNPCFYLAFTWLLLGEKMGRNELKIELLEYLSNNGGEITSGKASQLFGITPIDASVQLLRYHRQGLLHRRKRRLHPFGGREYCYSLSDRGIERLNWLIDSEEISIRLDDEPDEDEIAVELEDDY
jgi:hypothetical protein